MKKTGLVVALVAALAASACTDMTPRQQDTISSNAMGAAAGATAGYVRGNRQQ